MGRRNSEVELCFDSMTDLITNLAGGLILIVMLLLALTREAPKTIKANSVGKSGKNDGEKPTRPLFEKLNILQADTARMNEGISSDAAQLKSLEKDVEKLIERIRATGKASSTPPEKK